MEKNFKKFFQETDAHPYTDLAHSSACAHPQMGIWGQRVFNSKMRQIRSRKPTDYAKTHVSASHPAAGQIDDEIVKNSLLWTETSLQTSFLFPAS